MAGRPTLLTPELSERFMSARRAGAPMKTACAHAGIHPSTLSMWRKKGREGVEPYATFIADETRANRQAQLRWLAKIQELGDARDDWRAYAWLLSRTFPDEFGDRSKVELEATASLSTNDGAVVLLGMLTDTLPEPKTEDDNGDD